MTGINYNIWAIVIISLVYVSMEIVFIMKFLQIHSIEGAIGGDSIKYSEKAESILEKQTLKSYLIFVSIIEEATDDIIPLGERRVVKKILPLILC